MSFFRYEYPLLKPLISTEYIDLLSVQDIAAMKVIALVQRGTQRDFVDLYYLLRRYRLESLLRWTKRKYAAFNPYMGLRALTYFQDAEQDRSRRRLDTFEAIAWSRIKREITDAVDRHRKERLSSR